MKTKRMLWFAMVAGLVTAATPASAAVRTASSCSQSAVQSAINAAVDRDTVVVPAGTCTWSAAVTVRNKTIILRGAGTRTGGTKIVYGGSNHSLLVIDAGAKTGRMDVSGFWFFGGDANYWGGTALWFDGPMGWKRLRIHHNIFDNNKQWSVRGNAATYGLIDNNTFRGSAHGIEVEGRGDADWTTPLVLGTADFFFIERNTFAWNDWYGSTGAAATDFVNGGRVVFRYNNLRYGFMETHDKARSGKPSANAWEVYNNTFWTSTSKWKGLDIAAGTGVIWGNQFTGDWIVPVGAMDYKTAYGGTIPRCDGHDPADMNVAGQFGWRCQYQIGTQNFGPSAISKPAYVWGNTLNGAQVGMVVTEGASHVRPGREFFNNGTTAKPGYAPYTYPHPLAAGN